MRGAVEEAVARLGRGEVVQFPTETVFGLGANPFDEDAVEQLLALKARRPAEGIPLIIADICALDHLGAVQPRELRAACSILIERFWPGPLTLVFDGSASRVAAGVFGPDRSLAVRVSPHPLAARLASGEARAVTATSANPHGLPPAKNVGEAERYFPQLFVVEGDCLGDSPSTILDVRTKEFRVLREGAVPAAELAALDLPGAHLVCKL